MTACEAELDRAGRRSPAARTGCSCSSRAKPRSTTKAKSADQQQAQQQAELLAGDGEDEIEWASGSTGFHRAFAGAAADAGRHS